MRRRHAGFSMIEILVALVIGLFLLFGLSKVLQVNKRTFTSQNLMSQLQDSERLAATMMNDVIEQAGYFPNPAINTASSSFASVSPFAQGQSIYGTYSSTAPGDSISVRYTTAPASSTINCTGGSNSGASNTTYTNSFSVVVTGGVSQLVCTRENGVVYPLINNVTNLSVLYGVNTSGSGNNVDTYMNASQVTAALDWNNVLSVKITLTFLSPLVGAPGQPSNSGPTNFLLTRTINIMQQTG